MCRMKHIFLGHLSAENNTPALAYNTVTDILEKSRIKIGKDVKIEMAQRNCPSSTIEIRV